MKKYLALFVAALAFAGCTKELPVDEPGADEVTSIVFDFAINRPDDTKAVKTGWESGDRIYVFFEDVTTGYVTIDFNGTEWSTPVLNGSATVEALTESGKHLTAVYLPFNNSASCTYDVYSSYWTFDGGFLNLSSYYMSSEKVSYTVTISEGIATLSAPLALRAPEGLVQIFIPDDEATGTIWMSCNALKSVQLDNIAIDGTISGYMGIGENVVGHAATIKGAKGYYAYGVIPDDWSVTGDAEGDEWYFSFDFGGGVYYDFYKHLASPITGGTAIKLASDLHRIGAGYYVTMGGLQWSTVNSGADSPWGYEYTPVNWGELPSTILPGERIPTRDEVDALHTATTDLKQWWITVSGFKGFLCVDNADASKYLFFPATGAGTYGSDGNIGRYWTSSYAAKGDIPDYWGVHFPFANGGGWGAYRVGGAFQTAEKSASFPVRPVKDIPTP
ncbi:MAG: hypothetical protein IJU27_07020 [Bacteroidales bacterium]|nr:hypothetical protein [Bacteroidales bacterium]